MGDLSESFKPGDIATASDAASDAVSKVATISDAASDALSKAYSRCAIISDAASKAMSRANTQSDAASKALSKASDALSKVNAASDASSKALSKANVALSNASDAQSAATAYLDQSVKTTASPTFAAATIPTIHGYSWQVPVGDKDVLNDPGANTVGDRYLIAGTGAGVWTGKNNQIAHCASIASDISGWTKVDTGTKVTQPTPGRGGSGYAVNFNVTDTTPEYLRYEITPNIGTIDIKVYFKFDIANFGSGEVFIPINLDDAGVAERYDLYAKKVGTYIQFYSDMQWSGGSNAMAYTNFTNDSSNYHYIHIQLKYAAGGLGYHKVSFDDEDFTEHNVTGLTTTAVAIKYIMVGCYYIAAGWSGNANILIDDVTINNGTADILVEDFETASWTYSTPAEGWMTWVEDEDAIYYYSGAAWALHYSGTYTFFDPDKFPASPTSQSDHFDDASIDGKWTAWQAGGSLTVAESDHHLRYTNTGDNAYTWRGHFQALPAGDFTITTKVNLIWSFVNYFSVGLALYEDAAANPNTSDVYAWTCEIPLGYVQTRITYLNAYNSWNSSPADKTHSYYCVPYLRIRRSGTTLYFEYSLNGIYWFQQYTVAQPFVPKEMGLIMMNYANTVTGYGLFDFFYYEAANNVLPLGGSRTVMLG